MRRKRACAARLEELESRLAPASFAVNAQLEISRQDNPGATAGGTHAVVFFESAVADCQVLAQGLAAGTDAVWLDSGGDGLREMAAFLAARHDLSAIGVVAHGAPGVMALGTATLGAGSLSGYAGELAVIGSALAAGGELDLWSCDVAAGREGSTLVGALARATGAGVAAAGHPVGSAALGGNWQLDARVGGARALAPFAAQALGTFPGLLDSWGPAASLATARGNQTATLLINGKVLVAGGQGTGGYLASAELYDPATDTWTAAGSMATARFLHTATLLNNGKVLVSGGFGDSGFLSSAELYDPVSNSWSPVGALTTARDLHTATLLASGKVLVTGGFNNALLSSSELYDPVSNSWSAAGPLATPRDQHTATLLGSGKVLVTGGNDQNSNPLASAELYDPVASTWSAAASMATARYLQTATLLGSGKLLVAGGVGTSFGSLSSAELYDPAGNTWSGAGSMTTARDQHAATLLQGGAVLVTGGVGNTTLPSTELYDPVQNTWSAAAAMTMARTIHTATLLGSGHVLVTGGAGNSGWLASAELYSPNVADPVTQFLVNVLGGNTVVAGNPFLFTAQAADQRGNPVTNYGGPFSVMTITTPADPLSNWPVPGTLDDSGFGFFQGNLKKAGSYTLTTSAGSVRGTSAAITVTPAAPAYFTLAVPAAATTGSPVNTTVTALDQFGNTATAYSGHVHFTSSDPGASLPADPTLASGVGIFSVTLNTGGSQTITATDTVSARPLTITGTSTPITTRGLTVASFTPTPTGFTVAFSKPFLPDNLSLYGAGLQTVADVTLVGAHVGAISGSLLAEAPFTAATFKATTNSLSLINHFTSAVLPDDTYTATLFSGSGSDGFRDALGAGLDGAGSGGHANYSAVFTTQYLATSTPVLSIPDFARGPDDSHPIMLPNDSGHGMPITLYNAAGVTDVTFTLSYDPSLLTVAAGSSGDATDPASSFTLLASPTIIDATHASANFQFHSSSAQSGTVVLGDIQALVPNKAAGNYKTKELLQLGAITSNGVAFNGVSAGGIHVNAYFGDVTGNGTIDGLDVATAYNVAQGKDTGFASYPLLDPAIVGDVALDYSVDAGDVSDLAAFTARLPMPVIPTPPSGLAITPMGADPTLSLVHGFQNSAGWPGVTPLYLAPGPLVVSVLLDQPHPPGSMGMTQAILALSYDPSVLAVSAADITLGSIPALGVGWQLSVLVDPAKGQIGIALYSTTPIAATQGGSLVNIVFHPLSAAAAPAPAVELLSIATPDGQQFLTQVDDAQGPFVLSNPWTMRQRRLR